MFTLLDMVNFFILTIYLLIKKKNKNNKQKGERMDEIDNNYKEKNELIILSEKGFKQAEITGIELEKLNKENKNLMIVSSPFLRCLQTSEQIAKTFKKKFV